MNEQPSKLMVDGGIEEARGSLFALAVNGQPVQIDTDPETPLAEVLTEAILLSGNERWGGVDRWECRNPRGELLDDSTALGDVAPNVRGISVFIQLKPGVGA